MVYRLQNLIRLIVDIFLRPFGQRLPILLALTVLTALTNGFHWWRIGFSSYAVYTFCEQLITVYLLVALIGILRGTAYKVCSCVLVVWSAIWCMIDTFCFTEMIAPFSEDFAASIKGTNEDEASEFIETFFSRRTLVYLCVEYALALAVWWLAHRMAWKAGRRLSAALVCVMALMVLPILRNSTCLKENPLYKTGLLLSNYESVDMNKFNRTPQISVNDPNTLTEEVIIVVGESFARNHSSLYGYGLPTNPRLQALVDEGRLVLFTDARSAKTYTVGSFVCFMSEGEGDGDDWQSRRLIPCVFDKAGYHTSWLSNQSKHGMVDNIVSSFAALCDTSVFIGNQFSGIDRLTYDGELLPFYHKMQAEDHDRRLSVIHLLGSHNTFAKRYPAE